MTTAATDTSIVLQLSLVQSLLNIRFLQQNISEGVIFSTLIYKKEVNSVRYDYLQISPPRTSVGLLNFLLEFELFCFVMCIFKFFAYYTLSLNRCMGCCMVLGHFLVNGFFCNMKRHQHYPTFARHISTSTCFG